MTNLNKYSDQINDLAMFAKANGFNPQTDDILELAKSWIKNRKDFYSEDNKEEVKRLVKQFI